jgi:hypothetical protein
MGFHHNPIEGSHYEPDDPPELPEGWWDEDTVQQVQEAIKALDCEPILDAQGGVALRFACRIVLLKRAAGMLEYNDPQVISAENLLGNDHDNGRGVGCSS